MIKPRHFSERIVAFILLFLWGVDSVMAQVQTVPEAYLPQTHFEFPAAYKGQKLKHEFLVQNKGAAVLEIIEVRTD